jgi:hypothetical protein
VTANATAPLNRQLRTFGRLLPVRAAPPLPVNVLAQKALSLELRIAHEEGGMPC